MVYCSADGTVLMLDDLEKIIKFYEEHGDDAEKLEKLKVEYRMSEEAFDAHIEKLAEERQAFRKEYRRALDVDSLAPRHTGLFIRGHNILPSWLLTLVFVIIFIMAVYSSHLILDQQEQIGHQKSQIEHLLKRSLSARLHSERVSKALTP